MVMVKVSLNGELMDVVMYEKYRNALTDVIDKKSDLYSCLPDESIIDFSSPNIRTVYYDNSDFGTDFEFRFLNGVTVLIGKAVTMEESMNQK